MLFEHICWVSFETDDVHIFKRNFMILPSHCFASVDQLVDGIRSFFLVNSTFRSQEISRADYLFELRKPHLGFIAGLPSSFRHFLSDEMMIREVAAFTPDTSLPFYMKFTITFKESSTIELLVMNGRSMYHESRKNTAHYDHIINGGSANPALMQKEYFEQSFCILFQRHEMSNTNQHYLILRNKLYKWLVYQDIDPGYRSFW